VVMEGDGEHETLSSCRDWHRREQVGHWFGLSAIGMAREFGFYDAYGIFMGIMAWMAVDLRDGLALI
jgi:hypothetical protein